MKFSVTAVIVNYKTPDLTEKAVKSLFRFYPEIPIFVIDNEADSDSASYFKKLQNEIPTLNYFPQEKNWHHGPGMDLGVKASKTDWILVFDSDCEILKPELLENMFSLIDSDVVYMVGQKDTVDENGKDLRKGEPGIGYIHPKCALVRKSIYLEFSPFEIHGAPCLKNEKEAVSKGFQLVGFPVRDYVFHLGRGTVNRFGYRLGWWGRVKSYFKQRGI